jgi:hypothetical protein
MIFSKSNCIDAFVAALPASVCNASSKSCSCFAFLDAAEACCDGCDAPRSIASKGNVNPVRFGVGVCNGCDEKLIALQLRKKKIFSGFSTNRDWQGAYSILCLNASRPGNNLSITRQQQPQQ